MNYGILPRNCPSGGGGAVEDFAILVPALLALVLPTKQSGSVPSSEALMP